MPSARYRHHGCRITDELLYKGMRTLFLENEVLRVGILLDKGADIFQFLHKPSDTDFLWRSPNGLIDPRRFQATIANPSGAFLDMYHGGWQEIFPGGGPVNYRGADLGLHGEVDTLGWDYDIIEDKPGGIAIRLSVDCVRTPFHLERVMRLESGRAILFIEECLTNLSPEPHDFMWGHHPALGEPFLREGVRIFVPAGKVQVHLPKFASSGILEPGAEFAWPLARTSAQNVDLSAVPGKGQAFAELLYLKDLSAGWYAVVNPETRLGFGMSWPLEVFPYLWFWMVYGSAPGYPWWDRVNVIALEPWTSIPNNLDEAIQAGRQGIMKGGGSLKQSFCAVVLEGQSAVQSIDPDGIVH
jgi:hypothetical protein